MKFNSFHLFWLVIIFLVMTNLAFFFENQKNIVYARDLSENWRSYRVDLVKQVCDVNLFEWKESYDRNKMLEALDKGFYTLEKFST